MATKKKAAKPAPKKVNKPVAKKPAPKAARPASGKAGAKPVKKQAPAKKPAAKAVAKKLVKPLAKKPTAKPIAKKVIKPVAKPIAKKASKPAAKPVAKKAAAPAKKSPVKPIQNQKTKAPIKASPIKPVAKPLAKEVMKKPNSKEPINKPQTVKATAKNVKDIKVLPPISLVVPKITTSTSRKYQPDFTKSVLDQPKHDLGASIVRYNDRELIEFRDLIDRKLEAAKKELMYLQGLITRKDEMGGDETDNRYMTMEDGSLSMEREQLSQMASRQITFIDHLEKAIMRIENKTYGICRITGQLIDKARLRAVPHATLCMEAKLERAK